MIGNESSGMSFEPADTYPYACAAGMMFIRNGQFTIGKLLSFAFNRASLSVYICQSKHDFTITGISLISCTVG